MTRPISALCGVAAALALAAPAAQAQTPTQTPAQTPAERIVAIAQQELALNVREIPKGSNKAPRIRMYGLSTQAPLRYYPAPWCAYFSSWVTRQAGVPIGADGLGDGYVPRIRAWARKARVLFATPRPGDLITFPQHMGIVESLQPNGLVTTIEGNTGDAVRRKLRLVKSSTGFVRAALLTAPVAQLSTAAGTVYRTDPVTLTARNVAVPSRAIKLYEWDLNGDGDWDKTTKLGSLTIAFPENGVFPITVQITDLHGVRSSASIELSVVSRAS